jgi:hypothetical protein
VNSQPVRWRLRWAFAQLTGVLFSTAVWVVLIAAAPWFVAGALLAGAVLVAAFRTRPVLRLAFGARPAVAADRDAVLRAIVPVASLRGRNQPQVFVASGRRAAGGGVLVPGPRVLVVWGSLVASIRSGALSDLEVSALVARAFGQLPAFGSKVVLAVDLYCLPWAIVESIATRIQGRLARMPSLAVSWRMRLVVFGLGLIDAFGSSRWEAALLLVVVAVLTYTTGPSRRAWQRRLAELGDRCVTDEHLDTCTRSVGDRAAADKQRTLR